MSKGDLGDTNHQSDSLLLLLARIYFAPYHARIEDKKRNKGKIKVDTNLEGKAFWRLLTTSAQAGSSQPATAAPQPTPRRPPPPQPPAANSSPCWWWWSPRGIVNA